MREPCKNCTIRKDCGFVSRGMEDGCTNAAYYEQGYEDAIEKAAEWLDGCLIDYWQNISANPQSFINDFRKAMEEQQ